MCSDVIEHLLDPLPLVRSLVRLSQRAPFVVVSTPDRERARGLLHMGPPCNLAHVREWTLGELGRLFAQEGLVSPYLGYTRNTDQHRYKSTCLLLAGRQALGVATSTTDAVAAYTPKRTLAIVSCYNDVDVIASCYAHLRAQGIAVWFVDNWSTDGTYAWLTELQQRDPQGCVGLERYPAQGPSAHYDWHGILTRKAQIAAEADFDWFIHHDSDELRHAPMAGMTLAEAIARVDALGYNAIDHTVIDFRPTDAGYRPGAPLAGQFHHFEFGRRPGHFLQIKAFKKQSESVDLATSGGQAADFAGRKVYPLKFLLAHYSLRSPALAARKLLMHRAPRVAKERARYGWHVQVEQMLEQVHQRNFVWPAHDLLNYNPHQFAAEYLVERLSGLDLVDDAGPSPH